MPRPARFHLANLPKELRLLIWEACINQAQRRLVIVDRHSCRIRPTLRLISPFLSVNTESHAVAQSFYRIRLLVFKADPEVDVTNEKYEDKDNHHNLAWRAIERQSPCCGVVYVNTESDVFVLGPHIDEWYVGINSLMGESFAQQLPGCRPNNPGAASLLTPYNYFTSAIPLETRERVKNMMEIDIRDLLNFDEFGGYDPIYTQQAAKAYIHRWDFENPFPNVLTCRHLWTDYAFDYPLEKMIRSLSSNDISEFMYTWQYHCKVYHRSVTSGVAT